jgi:hypothetical protein
MPEVRRQLSGTPEEREAYRRGFTDACRAIADVLRDRKIEKPEDALGVVKDVEGWPPEKQLGCRSGPETEQLYRLWVGNEDFGITAEEPAKEWLEVIRERYPDENIRIQPVAAEEATFPVGSKDDPEPLSAITSARCPHCQALVTFPGFDAMLAFVCPECGESVRIEPTKH